MKKGGRALKLLSPADYVKDRLAAFYHWNDRQSLEQAVLVCKEVEVDPKKVERWSINEGESDKYDIFTLSGTIKEKGVEYLVKRSWLFGISVVNKKPRNRIRFKDMMDWLKRIGQSEVPSD